MVDIFFVTKLPYEDYSDSEYRYWNDNALGVYNVSDRSIYVNLYATYMLRGTEEEMILEIDDTICHEVLHDIFYYEIPIDPKYPTHIIDEMIEKLLSNYTTEDDEKYLYFT